MKQETFSKIKMNNSYSLVHPYNITILIFSIKNNYYYFLSKVTPQRKNKMQKSLAVKIDQQDIFNVLFVLGLYYVSELTNFF